MGPLPSEFQVFVKPVGARCNLHCRYCYYLDHENLPGTKDRVMSESMLENYTRQLLEASVGRVAFFAWHGGEPTLAGLDFYRKAVELQRKYRLPGQEVVNGIQTNATLLDEDWCRFFSRENFLVGVSLDGPEKLHNQNRRNRSGKPVFKEVLKGLECLKKHGVIFEILCVVHRGNVGNPLEVYRYFRSLGARFISFLPLVEDPGKGAMEESVPARAFGEFLVEVFEEWKSRDIGRVQVQIFEEALRTAFGQDHTLCIFKKSCGGVPVVEMNGDFYSCDHFVDPTHPLGNIGKESLSGLLAHPQQLAFGRDKWESLPRYCLDCEVLDMCHGECPKNRFLASPQGEPGLNYLCEGYRHFFNHIRPFARAVARAWQESSKDG